jgi:hypothetical protein
LALRDGLSAEILPDHRTYVSTHTEVLRERNGNAGRGLDICLFDRDSVVDTDSGFLPELSVDTDDALAIVFRIAGPDPCNCAVTALQNDIVAVF